MAWAAQGSLRGPQGPAGGNGRGVTAANLDGNGELVLTFTDGATANVGVVRGPAGPAGTSVRIRGSVANAAALPTEALDPALVTGDGFITGDDGHLHVYDDVADTWTDAGSVRGPQGESVVGPAGPRGAMWFSGAGAPGTLPGSQPGDMYLDTVTGDVYTLA